MARARTTPTTSLDAIRGRATIPVWDSTRPSLAGVLGIGRAAAYAMVQRGDVPGVLRIGARVVIACPALLAWLGETAPLIGTQAEPAGQTPSPVSPPRAALTAQDA